MASTRRAHTSVDHEYSQCVPGWKRSGSLGQPLASASGASRRRAQLPAGARRSPMVARSSRRLAGPVADAGHVHERVADGHRALGVDEPLRAVLERAPAPCRSRHSGRNRCTGSVSWQSPCSSRREQRHARDRLGHRVERQMVSSATGVAALGVHASRASCGGRRAPWRATSTWQPAILPGVDVAGAQVVVDRARRAGSKPDRRGVGGGGRCHRRERRHVCPPELVR